MPGSRTEELEDPTTHQHRDGRVYRVHCRQWEAAKTFNLQTSKLHALGDYVETIKMFGTTDSYSTQIVRYWGLFDKLP